MPITATELSEVAPRSARAVLNVDDDYVVTIGNSSTAGTAPNGSFSVLDTATEHSLLYSGLPTTTSSYSPESQSCVHSGYVWLWHSNVMYRVAPSTGAVTSISMSGPVGVQGLVGASGVVWVIGTTTTRGYRLSDGSILTPVAAMTTVSGGAVGYHVDDGLIYARTSSTVVGSFDPTDGAAVATWTATVNAARLLSYDGKLWSKGSGSSPTVTGFDPLSGLVTTHTITGAGSGTSDGTIHTDGWLYWYGATADQLIGLDPATGAFGFDALPTSRTGRFGITSAAGKLWIPSGDPLT